MDATDSSDPSVFFESALANVNGKCWLRNKFKVSNDLKLDTEPEKTDPITYNLVVRDGIPHNLLIRSEEFENVAWCVFPSVSDVDIQANAAISPDGQETAEIISVTVANAGVDQTVSAVPSSTYAFMV
jgi:hypothetical protein